MFWFTKQQDISSQDLTKIFSLKINIYDFPIILKFDRQLSSIAAELPVKF